MEISVALCTYNGALFINEQLDSIINQSVKPTEIIICDDCSSDQTIEVLENYILKNQIKNIKLFQNKNNLGYVKNFEKCISLCTGDYIFLSDQDDVWLPNKIERILFFFDTHPSIDMVFTNALLVDENLKSLNKTMADTLNFDLELKSILRSNKLFKKLLYDFLVTGATVCFKKNQIKNFLPIPINKFQIHDGWFGLIAAYQNKLAYIDECLIKYRQHQSQSVGAKLKFETINSNTTKNNRLKHFIDICQSSKYYDELMVYVKELDEMNNLLFNSIKEKNLVLNDTEVNYKHLKMRKNYFNYLQNINSNRILRLVNSLRYKRNILPFTSNYRAAISFFLIELFMKSSHGKS
jgi:glycosyltransferase involved in cell wall biosynthesis